MRRGALRWVPAPGRRAVRRSGRPVSGWAASGPDPELAGL